MKLNDAKTNAQKTMDAANQDKNDMAKLEAHKADAEAHSKDAASGLAGVKASSQAATEIKDVHLKQVVADVDELATMNEEQ
jgi:hypothetical protein